MACQVGKGVGGLEEVTFLYRLTPGACPKSYGVNVARLAGNFFLYSPWHLVVDNTNSRTLAFGTRSLGLTID